MTRPDTPESDKQSIRERLSGRQRTLVVLLLSAVLIGSATVVVAQQTLFDDFEDGNHDGWQNDNSGAISISEQSVAGNYSLLTDTSYGEDAQTEWVGGPDLNVSDGFYVSGTIKPEFIEVESGNQIRIGVSSGDSDQEGENAYLLFDAFENETYLSTYDQPGQTGDAIQNSFSGEWVNFEMQTSNDSNTVNAKVWPYGTEEPEEFQIQRDFSGTQDGSFVVNSGHAIGTGTADRNAYLDGIGLSDEAEEPGTGDLIIDTRLFLEHGESAPYSVMHESTNDTNNRTTREVITNESTVTSGDTSVVTVNQEGQEIVATDDVTVNNRTSVTAEWTNPDTGETLTGSRNVTVANETVDNLDILPPVRRFTVSLQGGTDANPNDKTIMLLIIGTAAAAAASRIATSFAGIAALCMVMQMGWIMGITSDGMAMVTVFIALFCGLNTAGNVDYTVQR